MLDMTCVCARSLSAVGATAGCVCGWMLKYMSEETTCGDGAAAAAAGFFLSIDMVGKKVQEQCDVKKTQCAGPSLCRIYT